MSPPMSLASPGAPCCTPSLPGNVIPSGSRTWRAGHAGKRRSGRTRKGNAWLRSTLVESARAAVRNRGCYLSAQYHALARRRGDKKAIVAVGHSILVAAWHILRDGVEYRDLGPDHFDRLNRERLVQYHTRRLAELGLTVQLPGAQATA